LNQYRWWGEEVDDEASMVHLGKMEGERLYFPLSWMNYSSFNTFQ
jgi:hypothetical protein